MTRPVARPGGTQPPVDTVFGDRMVSLRPLAVETTVRHLTHHPEDAERYGDALAEEWCIHDMQHVVAWAFGDIAGYVRLADQVAWLARVLSARGYPVANLYDACRDAADVVEEHVPGASAVAERLRAVSAP